MAARIVVVGGPTKGAAYFLKEGANTIGRDPGNNIALSSGQVSKQHCTITINGMKAEVVDNGSSNGTFVNGVLARKANVKPGDKVSIGPFVFEFILGADAASGAGPYVGAGMGGTENANVDLSDVGGEVGANEILGEQLEPPRSEREKSVFKKLFYKFDETVTPVLHDFNTRNEWWYMLGALFLMFVLVYVGVSVYPLLETAKESVLQEAEGRAKYIARSIAHENQAAVESDADNELDVDAAEKDPDVVEALILGLDGTVKAPGIKINEGTTNPYITKVLRALRGGKRGAWKLVTKRNEDNTRLLVTVPIFAKSPKSGKEVPKALVVVKFRLSGIALNPSIVAVIYLESILMALLVGSVFIFLVFRLTYKPIETVNDDLDEVLKGNMPSVQKRFQFDPLNQLIDSVNSLVSRIPELSGKDDDENVEASDNEQQIIDNMMMPMQYLVTNAHMPMMLMDGASNVLTMSGSFEELTGIHADAVAGMPIHDAARDEAFAGMMQDMMEKAPDYGPEGVREEYEFSAGLYNIVCLSVSSLPEKIEAYLVSAEPAEEEDYG